MDAKSVGAIVLVVSCFLVVYPRIFHPILMNIFGLNPKKAQESPEQPPFHPGGMHARSQPNAGGNPQGMGGHGSVYSELRRQALQQPQHERPRPPWAAAYIGLGLLILYKVMQNFPHPGMRAQPHNAPPGGGGGGKGGWVTMILPVYSIGIVIYLVYTLSKIWSNKDNRFETGRAFYGGQQCPPKHAETPSPGEVGGEEESLEGYKSEIQRGQKQLERLLLKANDNTIEREEMIVLRQRLRETEAQLTRIMTAMESMHGSVEEVVSNAGEEPENTESNESKKADTQCTDADNDNDEDIEEQDEMGNSDDDEASTQEDIEDQNETGNSDDDSVSGRLSNSEDIRPSRDVTDDPDDPAGLPDVVDVVEELMPEQKEDHVDGSVRRRLHCEESEV